MSEEQQAPAPAAPESTAVDSTELHQLKAQLAELMTAKQQADKAAEEARKASLTESERLAEEKRALDAERNKLKLERRKDALVKLGVLEKAAALAPDADPTDPAGAKALEDWAKANPEFVRKADTTSFAYDAPKGSNLGKILSGEAKSPIISVAGLRKLLGGE